MLNENNLVKEIFFITYPIFADTYITDLYFSVYCIYFFEPENFFCK